MRKKLLQYKVFILTLIIGVALLYFALNIIVDDIFGIHTKFLTPMGEAIWALLLAPIGYLLNYIFETNGSTFAGIYIDILIYSFLFQFLWNRYKRKKGSNPNS